MAVNKTQIKDKGWERIKREMKVLDKATVKVGFPEGTDGHEDDEVSTAEVAYFNEFTDPQRPFMRQAFDNNKDDIVKRVKQLRNLVYKGTLSADQALRMLGELHKKHVQERITALDSPPNAESTIDQKGSSNPLVDSGQMRENVNYEVNK